MKNFLVKLAFIIPALWWVYLFFTTQIIVVYDAEGYEAIGRTIYLQGWEGFCRTALQREPFFPSLVALSMWMGEVFKISYFYPLKIFGALFLFVTMMMSYRLMRMLSIDRRIAAAAVFYLGISPVMTNSSMRLWSEFAAYPWIVLAVWWTIKSWQMILENAVDQKGIRKAFLYGAALGGIFLLIMSVKAVAEPILIVYLCPFYWQIFSNWRRKNYGKAKQVIVFCLATLFIFEGVLASYKGMNYHYSGQYEYTSRWDWALWGYCKRRSEPLTFKKLQTAVAFVPGMGICVNTFGHEDCDFWSTRYSDDLMAQKKSELNAEGIAGENTSKFFVNDSIKLFFSHFIQQTGLILIEAHKIFFWESAIAFVAYPDWLERILHFDPWMNTLKIVLAALSWMGLMFAAFYIFRRKSSEGIDLKKEKETLFFISSFIVLYTAAYAVYFIVDRYAFPVISLFLVLAAFMVNKLANCFREIQKRKK